VDDLKDMGQAKKQEWKQKHISYLSDIELHRMQNRTGCYHGLFRSEPMILEQHMLRRPFWEG
jgi:hypothetical protein